MQARNKRFSEKQEKGLQKCAIHSLQK